MNATREAAEPMIRWTQAQAVGVPVIDEEHRQLFALAERLHQAMVAGRGKEILGNLLAELAEYTSRHFAHEEELMTRINDAHRWELRQEHENLRSRVRTLRDRFARGEVTMTIELSLLLADWMAAGVADRPRAPRCWPRPSLAGGTPAQPIPPRSKE